jgi:hypothetical protein
VDLPKIPLSKLIPSILLETFQETNVFEAKYVECDILVTFLNNLLHRYHSETKIVQMDDNWSLETLIGLYSFADLYLDPTLFEELCIKEILTDKVLKKLEYLYQPYMYLYEDNLGTNISSLIGHMNNLMEKIGFGDMYTFKEQGYKTPDTSACTITIGKLLPQLPERYNRLHAIKIIKYLIKKTDIIGREFKLEEDIINVIETMDINNNFIKFLKGEPVEV